MTYFQFWRSWSYPWNGWSESRQFLYTGRRIYLVSFLSRDATLARYMLWSKLILCLSVFLSVCLSVCMSGIYYIIIPDQSSWTRFLTSWETTLKTVVLGSRWKHCFSVSTSVPSALEVYYTCTRQSPYINRRCTYLLTYIDFIFIFGWVVTCQYESDESTERVAEPEDAAWKHDMFAVRLDASHGRCPLL